jgi:hypothetical protein
MHYKTERQTEKGQSWIDCAPHIMYNFAQNDCEYSLTQNSAPTVKIYKYFRIYTESVTHLQR